MADDLLSIIAGSADINEKLISRVRLEILWALSDLREDGATARQLKAGLNLNDGVLYSNLKKLEDFGYLRCQKTTIEGKELELYSITSDGITEWRKVRTWLRKLLGCEEDRCDITE